MSYKVKIIDAKEGDLVRNAVLKVVGRNVRGVPCKFELVEDEQTVDVSAGDACFVVCVMPAKVFEGDI